MAGVHLSESKRHALLWPTAITAVSIAAVALVLAKPIALVVIVAAVVLVLLWIRRPDVTSAVLVAMAIPLMRPAILGEHYASLATGLCTLAAFIVFTTDRNRARVPGAYWLMMALLTLAQLWMMFRGALNTAGSGDSVSVKGLITTPFTLAAVGLVLADHRRRQLVARCFLWMVLAFCASYAVTAGVWVVGGVGVGHVLTFSIDPQSTSAIVYFPFSPTLSATAVEALGVSVPRLTGLGREPGWMAMFIVFAWFLWPRLGKPRWFIRPLLLVGLLGTSSTAGFGVFVVAFALEYFLRPREGRGPFAVFVGFIVGAAAVWASIDVAINAPVLGLAAKATVNVVSLDERSAATTAGLNAILNHPLGGQVGLAKASISILASIAPFGVPYALLVLAAMVAPRLLTVRPRRGLTTTPVAVVMLTLLLSQPPGDSTLAYLLVGLTYLLVIQQTGPSRREDHDDARSAVPAAAGDVAV